MPSTSAIAGITQVTRPPTDFLPELTAPLNNLPQIARHFSKTYHELALSSSTQFLPTPITSLPNGKEKGKFLALDFGGSNLRVGVVELFGDESGDGDDVRGAEDSGSVSPSSSTHSLPLVTEPEHEPLKSGALATPRFRIAPSSTWSIPAKLKSTNAEALFDWVGECIASVIRTYLSQCSDSVAEEVTHEGLPLGVTFSFPMVQSNHTSALLMTMGKGFTFSTNNDLATLLTNAYARQRSLCDGGAVTLPKVEVVAITNDSISTLLAGGYVHKGNATVGIIAGTGTNATCLCPVGKLGEFKKPTQKAEVTHVLLNTEWSINGTLPPVEKYVTKWDKTLDRENEKPGFQPLEEMVGGRYLGELVRLVSVDVLGGGGTQLPSRFYKPYAVETKLCADVEGASRPEEAIEILRSYFSSTDTESTWEWTTDSATSFKKICETVSNRAAGLVVAATAGILDVNDDLGLHNPSSITLSEQQVVISFTGTILEKYPNFRERCQKYMDRVTQTWYDDLAGSGAGCVQRKKVRLVEAKDGGIIGAAVLAGMVAAGRT